MVAIRPADNPDTAARGPVDPAVAEPAAVAAVAGAAPQTGAEAAGTAVAEPAAAAVAGAARQTGAEAVKPAVAVAEPAAAGVAEAVAVTAKRPSADGAVSSPDRPSNAARSGRLGRRTSRAGWVSS